MADARVRVLVRYADDVVVLFDTGTGYKYVENMTPLWDGPGDMKETR